MYENIQEDFNLIANYVGVPINPDNNFLELNTDKEKNNDIFDDVQIVIDPELEDESTIDINNYLNKFILQCRVCGNMFPSTELLDNETECPICDSKSSDGFMNIPDGVEDEGLPFN